MIFLGVSGGVDSSVAGLLLKKANKPVSGVFMHNWEENNSECSSDKDRLDALKVCAKLNIPFSVRNFAKEYKESVFQDFLNGYAKGFTPNPDILCNREIKFKTFLEDALNNGATSIATGHYARKAKLGNSYALLRARDKSKDQSYFLHAITQHGLSHAEFPLGELLKSQVRDIAKDAGLITATKKDSTGICFIGEKDFKSFLQEYLPAKPGDIITENGQVIGRHNGALYYTIGQRAPVGGVKGFNSPWFILEKNVVDNTLIVGQNHDNPRLINSYIKTEEVSWINAPVNKTFEAGVQIRHLGKALPATIKIKDSGVEMFMHAPHRAVAIGQSAVIYQDDICLGGGVICETK